VLSFFRLSKRLPTLGPRVSGNGPVPLWAERPSWVAGRLNCAHILFCAKLSPPPLLSISRFWGFCLRIHDHHSGTWNFGVLARAALVRVVPAVRVFCLCPDQKLELVAPMVPLNFARGTQKCARCNFKSFQKMGFFDVLERRNIENVEPTTFQNFPVLVFL